MLKHLALIGILSTLTLSKSLASTESDVRETKPDGSEASVSEGKLKCRRLTIQATKRGIKILLIGFEGLLSFDSQGTERAYAAFENAFRYQNGMQGGGAFGGGYLLHELIEPVVSDFVGKTEFLVFPQTSIGAEGDSIPLACAQAWMSVPGHQLVILGHSYGGHAASELAQALNARKVSVSRMFTVDARAKYCPFCGFRKSENVVRWENYYELISMGLTGSVVEGADVNLNLSGSWLIHTRLPSSPVIHRAVVRFLQRATN